MTNEQLRALLVGIKENAEQMERHVSSVVGDRIGHEAKFETADGIEYTISRAIRDPVERFVRQIEDQIEALQ